MCSICVYKKHLHGKEQGIYIKNIDRMMNKFLFKMEKRLESLIIYEVFMKNELFLFIFLLSVHNVDASNQHGGFRPQNHRGGYQRGHGSSQAMIHGGGMPYGVQMPVSQGTPVQQVVQGQMQPMIAGQQVVNGQQGVANPMVNGQVINGQQVPISNGAIQGFMQSLTNQGQVNGTQGVVSNTMSPMGQGQVIHGQQTPVRQQGFVQPVVHSQMGPQVPGMLQPQMMQGQPGMQQAQEMNQLIKVIMKLQTVKANCLYLRNQLKEVYTAMRSGAQINYNNTPILMLIRNEKLNDFRADRHLLNNSGYSVVNLNVQNNSQALINPITHQPATIIDLMTLRIFLRNLFVQCQAMIALFVILDAYFWDVENYIKPGMEVVPAGVPSIYMNHNKLRVVGLNAFEDLTKQDR